MWLVAGSLLALIGVGAGAFGAHALRDVLTPELEKVYETAARYQMYHSIALVGLGILARGLKSYLLQAAGACFALGTIIFSGSLYALALTGFRAMGAITPIGGALLMLGWLLLAVVALQRRSVAPVPAP